MNRHIFTFLLALTACSPATSPVGPGAASPGIAVGLQSGSGQQPGSSQVSPPQGPVATPQLAVLQGRILMPSGLQQQKNGLLMPSGILIPSGILFPSGLRPEGLSLRADFGLLAVLDGRGDFNLVPFTVFAHQNGVLIGTAESDPRGAFSLSITDPRYRPDQEVLLTARALNQPGFELSLLVARPATDLVISPRSTAIALIVQRMRSTQSPAAGVPLSNYEASLELKAEIEALGEVLLEVLGTAALTSLDALPELAAGLSAAEANLTELVQLHPELLQPLAVSGGGSGSGEPAATSPSGEPSPDGTRENPDDAQASTTEDDVSGSIELEGVEDL